MKTAYKSIITIVLVSLVVSLLFSSPVLANEEDVVPPTITSGTMFIDDTEFSCADLVSHDTRGPYTVTVHAVDNIGIDFVILSYCLSGPSADPSDYIHVPMSDIGGDYYRGEIPGQPYGTSILYYITAYDLAGNFFHYEHPWHDPFSVRISPMITEPSITINGEEYPLSDENIIVFEYEGPYIVSAKCFTCTGISSVVLSYCICPCTNPSEEYVHIPMTYVSGDYYMAEIPEQPYGTSILVYITATCGAGHTEICEKTNNDPFLITLGAPPIASFTYSPEKPMVGGNIIFNASDSSDLDGGEIVKYEWDFDDGATARATIPEYSHVYESPAKYTVTLSVTDNDGQKNSTSTELDLTLKNGDLLLWRSPKSPVTLKPGEFWTHAGIYVEKSNKMVEARAKSVNYYPLSDWSWLKGQTCVRALRVKTDQPIRDKAVEFANGKIGQSYDSWSILLNEKQEGGECWLCKKWYCSELVWAAYLSASNGQINLDQDERGLVSPDDIDSDDDVEMIGEHKEAIPQVIYEEIFWGEAYSPVDLIITDPNGLILNKQGSEILGTIYEEGDINEDGELDDLFAIPDPKIGIYLIQVIPEPDAEDTDTYTLKVSAGDTTIVLAEDVPISDIPDQPYIIRSAEEGIIQIIPATVRIEPETLNLASKGVFTAFIQLPEGYDVSDINISTVECEDASAIEGRIVHGGEGGHHGKGHAGDTLKVKFNRQDLVDVPTGNAVMLTVTGKILHNDGEVDFEGSDTIRVINKGKDK